LSDPKKSKDAEDILSEFHDTQTSPESEPQLPSPESEPQPSPGSSSTETRHDSEERDVIFIGTKPIMTYVSATLTQLSTRPTVTIKARGKRITQAVDVSQMIVKRMNAVGYIVNDVRILSDSLTSQDGKTRNVSTIEIDITKN
jgi:DNA-binding protein Alba